MDAAKEAGKAVPNIAAVELDVTNHACGCGCRKDRKEFQKTRHSDQQRRVARTLSPDPFQHPDIYGRRATKLTREAFISPLELSYLYRSRHQDGYARQILNLTSIGAHMLLPAMLAYNAAKLAICRFTEYTAFEYADQGILAMAVHLGVR